MRVEDLGALLRNGFDQTASDRRVEAARRHERRRASNRAIQTRNAVDLRLGNPRSSPRGEHLQSGKYSERSFLFVSLFSDISTRSSFAGLVDQSRVEKFGLEIDGSVDQSGTILRHGNESSGDLVDAVRQRERRGAAVQRLFA